MVWSEKQLFLGILLVQVQQFVIGTSHGLDILHRSGKKVKTKSRKVLGAYFYACRSYRGKADRRAFLIHQAPIYVVILKLHSLKLNKRFISRLLFVKNA